MLRSPRHSASKRASVPGLFDRSVRRIFDDVFHFHPYKMAILQEPSKRGFNYQINACKVLLVPENAIVF